MEPTTERKRPYYGGGRKPGRDFPIMTRVRLGDEDVRNLERLQEFWGTSKPGTFRAAFEHCVTMLRPGIQPGSPGPYPHTEFLRLARVDRERWERLAHRWGCDLAETARRALAAAAYHVCPDP